VSRPHPLTIPPSQEEDSETPVNSPIPEHPATDTLVMKVVDNESRGEIGEKEGGLDVVGGSCSPVR